eukprot:gene17031-23323_t
MRARFAQLIPDRPVLAEGALGQGRGKGQAKEDVPTQTAAQSMLGRLRNLLKEHAMCQLIPDRPVLPRRRFAVDTRSPRPTSGARFAQLIPDRPVLLQEHASLPRAALPVDTDRPVYIRSTLAQLVPDSPVIPRSTLCPVDTRSPRPTSGARFAQLIPRFALHSGDALHRAPALIPNAPSTQDARFAQLIPTPVYTQEHALPVVPMPRPTQEHACPVDTDRPVTSGASLPVDTIAPSTLCPVDTRSPRPTSGARFAQLIPDRPSYLRSTLCPVDTDRPVLTSGARFAQLIPDRRCLPQGTLAQLITEAPSYSGARLPRITDRPVVPRSRFAVIPIAQSDLGARFAQSTLCPVDTRSPGPTQEAPLAQLIQDRPSTSGDACPVRYSMPRSSFAQLIPPDLPFLPLSTLWPFDTTRSVRLSRPVLTQSTLCPVATRSTRSPPFRPRSTLSSLILIVAPPTSEHALPRLIPPARPPSPTSGATRLPPVDTPIAPPGASFCPFDTRSPRPTSGARFAQLIPDRPVLPQEHALPRARFAQLIPDRPVLPQEHALSMLPPLSPPAYLRSMLCPVDTYRPVLPQDKRFAPVNPTRPVLLRITLWAQLIPGSPRPTSGATLSQLITHHPIAPSYLRARFCPVDNHPIRPVLPQTRFAAQVDTRSPRPTSGARFAQLIPDRPVLAEGALATAALAASSASPRSEAGWM